MIEKLVYDAINNYTPMDNLISGRVYPVELPDDSSYPAIVYININPIPENTLKENNTFCHARFQFDIWGETYLDIKEVLQQLEPAFGNSPKLAFVSLTGFEDKEDDTRLYRQMIEYSIWEKELPSGFLFQTGDNFLFQDESYFKFN